MNNKLRGRCRTAALIAGAALAGLTAARQTEAQTMASLPRPSYPVEALGEAGPCRRGSTLQPLSRRMRGRPDRAGPDRAHPARVADHHLGQPKGQCRDPAGHGPGSLGVPDRWDLAEDGQGDCEDFQLLKRRLLAEAGLPRRAMRMTVVVDDKGEGHAVLMIRTAQGDFVLDNKTSAILPGTRPATCSSSARARTASAGCRWAARCRRPRPRTRRARVPLGTPVVGPSARPGMTGVVPTFVPARRPGPPRAGPARFAGNRTRTSSLTMPLFFGLSRDASRGTLVKINLTIRWGHAADPSRAFRRAPFAVAGSGSGRRSCGRPRGACVVHRRRAGADAGVATVLDPHARADRAGPAGRGLGQVLRALPGRVRRRPVRAGLHHPHAERSGARSCLSTGASTPASSR